jgi:hypothetical protein
VPRRNKIVKHQLFSKDSLVCNKRRFRGEKEAEEAAEFQMLENMNINLSIYKCDLCGYWHLTRSNKKEE